MKIAVCLSGHLRSYEKTFLSFKKYIIDDLNPDIFIHTWNTIGIARNFDGPLVRQKTSTVFQDIKKWYNPKNIIIQPYQYFVGEKYRKYLIDRRCPNGVANMFYKIYLADKTRADFELALKENYDVVIRARPDILFKSTINRDDLNNIEDGTIYVPKVGHYGGINDQFAFGNSNSMKVYSSCFMKMDDICKSVKFVPEHILKFHVKTTGLKVKQSNIDFVLQRADGSVFDNNIFSPESYTN